MIALVALVGVGTVSACGVPGQDSASRIPSTNVPFGLAARRPSPSSSALPAANVEIYLIRGAGLVAVSREASVLSADSLVRLLASGPSAEESASGLRSAISTDDAVDNVAVSGSLATVDLSPHFSELPRKDQLLAVGQLVYSLTEIPSIAQLAFRLDGQPTAVPRDDGTLTDQPVSRNDYRSLAG